MRRGGIPDALYAENSVTMRARACVLDPRRSDTAAMRKPGLEPGRVSPLDPKSSASTKFRHFRSTSSVPSKYAPPSLTLLIWA